MPNYNTTLQTNNSSLEEIITQLNAMPDAGSGSGGTSVETCTISITFHSASIGQYVFTTYENGAFSGAYRMSTTTSLTSITIPNVVVGSMFYVSYSGLIVLPLYQLSGGISTVELYGTGFCGKVDSAEDGHIDLYEDD